MKRWLLFSIALLAMPSWAAVTLPPIYIGYTIGVPWVAPSGTSGAAPYCSGTTNLNIGGSGGLAQYCLIMTNVAPWIDYIVMPLRWPSGYNNTAADGNVDTGFELNTVPTSNPPPASQYSFTNLDQRVFLPLSTFTCAANLGRPHPCWFSLQLGPSQASSYLIPQAPDYVYQYGTGSWPNLAAYAWASGTTYYSGQTVSFGGSFYQLTTAVSCVPSGSAGPSADGCAWSGPLANAPPLDVADTASQTLLAPNTLPGTCNTSCASAGVYGVFNTNSNLCGSTGTASCANTLWLSQAVEAIWENPVLVAEINATNWITGQIAGKSYAANLKYFRPGLFTDGTSFNNAESALQTLQGNSQSNIESVIPGVYGNLLAQTSAGIRAIGTTLVDCNFADNSTAGDTKLINMCAQYGDMIGILGVQNSDLTAYYAGTRSTNAWIVTFQAQASTMKAYHLQSISQSDTTRCPLVAGVGFYCMPAMLAFVSQFRGSHPLYVELYSADIRCAFDSTWNGAGCNSTAPNASWANAIQAAGFGLPAPLGWGVASPLP